MESVSYGLYIPTLTLNATVAMAALPTVPYGRSSCFERSPRNGHSVPKGAGTMPD